MKTAGSIVAIALAAALAACGSKNAQNAPPQTAQAQGTTSGCPMAQLQGVHASVADTNDGVAITFTAPQNELDQLRSNVNAMVDANDKQGDAFAACPCGSNEYGAAENQGTSSGQTWSQSGQTSMQSAEVPAKAKESDIPTGAVLTLNAKDKNQVQALRDDVRQDIHAMQHGGCLSR